MKVEQIGHVANRIVEIEESNLSEEDKLDRINSISDDILREYGPLALLEIDSYIWKHYSDRLKKVNT